MNDGVSEGLRVAVIGAGIVGVATAVRLQQRGCVVTLVDRGAPGEATSFGNAGIMASASNVPVPVPGLLKKVPKLLADPMGPLSLRWSYLPRLLPWLIPYLRAGRADQVERIAAALHEIVGGSVEEHQSLAEATGAGGLVAPSRYLYVYADRAAFEADSFAWGLRARHGATWEVFEGPALRELEPALAPHCGFAVSVAAHGFVRDPGALVKAHAAHFERAGGTLLRREVAGFEVEGDRVMALRTAEGPVACDAVVISAGAWSARLAAQLGVKVPLESERGYHVTLTAPRVTLRQPLAYTPGKFVATPMAMGLRLAGLVEFGGLEAAPNYARARTLLEHARRIFPGVATEAFTEWMGHRPATPDSLPVIGRSPKQANVFFAFGHQHIGLTAGPRTGRLVADLVTDRRPNVDLAAFGAARF